MADEKKPGLLKRIFSFGFGKKKAEPEVEDNTAAEAAAAEAAAQKEAERLQAIKKAEEEALEASRIASEKAEAEKKAQEKADRIAAEEAKAKVEAEAAEKKVEAERAAAEKAEQKRLEKETALRIAAEEAKKSADEEAARLEAERAEELAAAEKAAEEKLASAKLAAEKADAKEAARLELEAAKEVERLQKEREAAELAEKERLEAAALKQAQDEADEAERLEKEKAELEKAEAERLAQEEADRLAIEEKLAAEEANAEKEAKEAAEQQAAEEQAKIEAEQAEMEAARIQAEEAAEAERLEQERLEKEKAEEETARLKAQEDADIETASSVEPEAEEPEEDEERKVGWFKRLTKGLARSSSALTENITSVFTKKKLDEDTLQDLEDILIQADLGVETAMNITDTLASQRMGKDVTDEEVRQIMADEIQKVLEPVAQPLELDLDHQPHVILVVGVNGSGKTTTIGKISQKLYNAGFSTLLVAGDTFRAAAVEQLHIWGDRTQAPVMSRPNGSDAAGLAFDAYEEAVKQKRDVMLMDTAGRLQNKKELMDELEKIIRVLKKQDENAPHTVLLTLDATTGQNALNQVEIFKDVAGVNGLVMTKLDGTARGGILVSISAKHKLPVYFIGVGEQVEDLEPFEADVFANAIAGIGNE